MAKAAIASAPGATPVSAPTARELSLAGLAAHRSGDVKSAERIYRESLAIVGDDPDVLHMLGVALMQQFDYTEARRLIERAGEMIGWSHPDFLHNRAHLLSVYLSGRARPGIDDRIAEVKRQRSQQKKQSVERVSIIAVQGADPAVNPKLYLSSFQNTGRFKINVSLASEEAVSGVRSPVTDSVRRSIEQTLRDRADLIVVLPVGTTFSEPVSQLIERFCDTGAMWGFVASEALPDKHADAMTQKLHIANTARLQGTQRVGMTLFDDHQLHPYLSISIYRAELFRTSVDTVSTESALDLAFDVLRRSEPVFLSERSIDSVGSTASDWWRTRPETFDRYTNWALDVVEPENPLAPCSVTDGLGFLKRSLRVWIGRYLRPQTLDRVARDIDSRAVVSLQKNDGIEYVGFARAESGLGESMRLLVRASTSVGLPCAVGDVALDVGVRQSDTSMNSLIVSAPTYQTRIVCVNPDSLGEALALDGFGAIKDAYQIGYWYWELESIPERWADSARLFQEVWVASDFVARAVRSKCAIPVRIITPPLLAPTLERSFSREEFGLDENTFVFLFSFAYGSFATRKNPEAVLRAFKEAFPRSITDVRLVVKTSQAEFFPAHAEALAREVHGDSRIVFLNKTLSREQLTGLQMVADCYVSLHRSEGLGLGMAESMSLGKPTIGTAYSGNLAFMNEGNSLLVDYSLVPIRSGEYIDAEGQAWADASIEDAARKMRFVYENRAEALNLGERARADLATRFSLSAVGERIRTALRHVVS